MLAGIGTAVLVAAVIIVAGSLAGTGEGETVPTADRSLPADHPAVGGKGSTPAADSSVQSDIERLESKSEAKPRDVGVLLDLGDAYALAQRYDDAERTFQRILDRRPNEPRATVRLAMVWHAVGETRRARHAIRRLLEARPRNQEAHYSLAILYFSLERVQDAREEWAKAAEIDPKSTIGRRSRNFVDLIDGQQAAEPRED